jgi:hypothetical protein
VVEHLTFNQGVDGSIPSGLTNEFNDLMIVSRRPAAPGGDPGAKQY